jgi:hypothetical protein
MAAAMGSWPTCQADHPPTLNGMRDDVAKAITVVGRVLDRALDDGSPADLVADLEHVLGVLQGIDPQPEQELVGAHVRGSRPPGVESPWPPEPPDATLMWLDPHPVHLPDLGYLHWFDVHGDRAAIPVTRGATTKVEAIGHVWHIEELPDDMLRVSPSVHFIGYWHSPNPVLFHRVQQLVDPEG